MTVYEVGIPFDCIHVNIESSYLLLSIYVCAKCIRTHGRILHFNLPIIVQRFLHSKQSAAYLSIQQHPEITRNRNNHHQTEIGTYARKENRLGTLSLVKDVFLRIAVKRYVLALHRPFPRIPRKISVLFRVPYMHNPLSETIISLGRSRVAVYRSLSLCFRP